MRLKTAIVTGSSGNLGKEVVKIFISEGYYVIGTTVPNDPVAMDFPADRFEKIVVDLMDEEESQKAIDGVVAGQGVINAAVLTVGGFAMGHIAETRSADILKQYKLNFETTYNIARPVFLQMMKQKSGRIFLIGSRPGLDARYGKGMIAYGLAKSLIFRLAELLNDEGKASNVVTSVIIPSTIDTPQNRKAMPDANPANWVKADDIAGIIYYYCSDEAAALREPVIKVYGNS